MIRHFKIKTPLPQLFQIKNDADDFAIPRWCEFRFNPATDSDLKSATVPI